MFASHQHRRDHRKIVLVDRGTCAFVLKAKNLQNAGAIAVLIADNAPGDPPQGMAGADPTLIIPSVRISLPAGTRSRPRSPEARSTRRSASISRSWPAPTTSGA
jgi:hypothetical protein